MTFQDIERKYFVKIDLPFVFQSENLTELSPHIRFAVWAFQGAYTLTDPDDPFEGFRVGAVWAYSPHAAHMAISALNILLSKEKSK